MEDRTKAEIIIGILLVLATFFGVRNYKVQSLDNQFMALKNEYQDQSNRVAQTAVVLQQGFDSGQINMNELIKIGWMLRPAKTDSGGAK